MVGPDFDALTERQQEVLGAIAINEDGGHHPRVLKALEAKGLIGSYQEPRGMNFKVVRYFVPTPIHIRWCGWCARQKE